MTSARPLTPAQAAILAVSLLERDGAVFTLREDDSFSVDLNGVERITTHTEAQGIADALLAMRDEIRAVLQSQRTRH